METIIINLKFKKKPESNYVYIGRGSRWGNPYEIGKDGDREEVIKKYEEYIRNESELLKYLPELVDKRLGCFCKPKACHGDILIKLMQEKGLIDKEQ